MFLHNLTDFLRKRLPAKPPQPCPSTRLRLEELENRVVPSFTTYTYTNAAVQITPGFTVTEKITATVTPFPFSQNTGISPGETPPTSGTVLFNLNNQQQVATLNGSNQATVTFQVPLLAFLRSQTLQITYTGSQDSFSDAWMPSSFLAPLYMNFDNLLLPGKLTFNQLTPRQVYAPFPVPLTPYNTAQGENDDFGLFSFQYVDPGTIETVTVLGIQLPGFFAIQLGAYGDLTSSSSK